MTSLSEAERKKRHRDAVRRHRLRQARDPEKFLVYIMSLAQRRANKHNREYTITPDFIIGRAKKLGFKCEKTGIPFVFDETKKHPFSVSIDRIDSSGGYTPDNCQLVCFMYNQCKNEWHDDHVHDFCIAYAASRESSC
jgi:hypothetical protein